MDSRRFDTLTRALGSLERRQVLALLPASLVAASGGAEAHATKRTRKQREHDLERRHRKRERRRRRKNINRCTSVGGAKVRCFRSEVCCDRERSNLAGCARRGFATCCRASEDSYYGFTNTYRCCPSAPDGQLGACPDELPVCCPGVCCPAGSDCSDLANCVGPFDESAPRHLVLQG